MLSAVASRYARALVEVVTEAGSGINPDQATVQLRQVAAMVEESQDLRNALLSPAVSPARKRAAVARLTAPLGIHGKIRNFLYVVIDLLEQDDKRHDEGECAAQALHRSSA